MSKLDSNVIEIIKEGVEKNLPKYLIAEKIGVQRATLDRYLDKLGIKYRGNNQYGRPAVHKDYIPAAEYIKSERCYAGGLKQKIIRENILPYRCDICGVTEWRGSIDNLVLELHHKNGIHKDNRLENIQLLCPNCHAMITREQWRRKVLTVKYAVMSELGDEVLLEGTAHSGVRVQIPVAAPKTKKHTCLDCGKPISTITAKKTGRCRDCFLIWRSNTAKLVSVTKEELKNVLRIKSFSEIARIYNVTDNLIRRKCKEYNLPIRRSDIRNMSDEEWAKL